tara:strand:+ start:6119 stop:6637 length:519 start_codon:yes stop_codon:yes gene_type:complete
MAYSYTNYAFDRVLTKFKNILSTEYSGSFPVYIGDAYKKTKNSHIRIFIREITDEDSKPKMLLNKVEMTVSLYFNIKSSNLKSLEKLRDETNRLEQVLYENRRDGNNYFDGRVEEIEFNIKEDDEVFVDNLLLSRINYSVKIPLNYSLYGFLLDSDGKYFTTANNKKLVILN